MQHFYKYNCFPSNKKYIAPVFRKQPYDNRPFIKINTYNHVFTFLLDSGANQSIVGEYCLFIIEKFNLKIDKNNKINVLTDNGERQQIEGSVYIPVCLNNVCKVVRFVVVPSIKHNLLLGSDFCKLFLLNIDFKNNLWNIQCKVNKCEIVIVQQIVCNIWIH